MQQQKTKQTKCGSVISKSAAEMQSESLLALTFANRSCLIGKGIKQ